MLSLEFEYFAEKHWQKDLILWKMQWLHNPRPWVTPTFWLYEVIEEWVASPSHSSVLGTSGYNCRSFSAVKCCLNMCNCTGPFILGNVILVHKRSGVGFAKSGGAYCCQLNQMSSSLPWIWFPSTVIDAVQHLHWRLGNEKRNYSTIGLFLALE